MFALNKKTNTNPINYEIVTHWNMWWNRLSSREGTTTPTTTNDAFDKIVEYEEQLDEFENWLNKIDQDLNYLEDFCIKTVDVNTNKQTVIELYKVCVTCSRDFYYSKLLIWHIALQLLICKNMLKRSCKKKLIIRVSNIPSWRKLRRRSRAHCNSTNNSNMCGIRAKIHTAITSSKS